MTVKQKVTGKTSSVPAGLAVGAMVSSTTTVVIAALLAILLNREVIPWETVGYGILVMIMLSAFLGAIAACSRIRRQRMIVCLMSGFIYYGVLLSMTALFFGGQYEAVGVTALLITGGCICAAMIKNGQGREVQKTKLKKLYR